MWKPLEHSASRSHKKKNCDVFSRCVDALAREKLILHNMRLVAHIIKKYYTNQTEQEDLLSIGTVGLMKAVSTFDYEKGARFATYASRCIENEILMHFRTCRKQGDAISMAEPIDTDKDGNQLTLLDIIEDGCDIQEQVASQMQIQQLYQFLQQKLTPREVEILVHRYGLYGQIPMTQREVAKKMGISRSYVSRLEKRAIAMLRKQYDQTPFPVFDIAGRHDRRKRVKSDCPAVLRSCQFQYLTACQFCPEQTVDEIRLWWHRKYRMPMHKTSLRKGNDFSSGNTSSSLHKRAAPR